MFVAKPVTEMVLPTGVQLPIKIGAQLVPLNTSKNVFAEVILLAPLPFSVKSILTAEELADVVKEYQTSYAEVAHVLE